MVDDFIPTDQEATEREPGYVGWDEHGPIFEAPEPEVLSRLLMAADGAPWWPRANRDQLAPADGGSILDGYGPKGLWHTTETDGFPGYASGYFPHMTCMIVDGRFVARQHIPFNRACRALRNESGGVQTNRTGVKQVEIVTRADIVDTHGLHPAMVDGLAEWATWLNQQWGVPLTCSVTFKPYPASYGKGNGVRLAGAGWERYAGWCGHQHAAENDHGDPGALNWRAILQHEEVDDMYDADAETRLKEFIRDEVARAVQAVTALDPSEGEENATYNAAGRDWWPRALTNPRLRELVEMTGVRLGQFQTLPGFKGNALFNAKGQPWIVDAVTATDQQALAARVEAIEGDVDHLVEVLAPPTEPPSA